MSVRRRALALYRAWEAHPSVRTAEGVYLRGMTPAMIAGTILMLLWQGVGAAILGAGAAAGLWGLFTRSRRRA